MFLVIQKTVSSEELFLEQSSVLACRSGVRVPITNLRNMWCSEIRSREVQASLIQSRCSPSYFASISLCIESSNGIARRRVRTAARYICEVLARGVLPVEGSMKVHFASSRKWKFVRKSGSLHHSWSCIH